MTTLVRYKDDLKKLKNQGYVLHLSIQAQCYPDQFEEAWKQTHGKDTEKVKKSLPSFESDYEKWYSECKSLIRQLLPDRLADFVHHYEKPKSRKAITIESYRIEDCLLGLYVTQGRQKEKVVGPEAAIPHFRQQLAILDAIDARFESSLFDIRRLVQADLFDNELDAAKALVKQKFDRAAGALAGVVLERHLRQVCEDHNIKIRKKSPGLADLNNALKENEVVEVHEWRFVQHLADIRNLCSHSKDSAPTSDQVNDLINGVMKIIKTVA